MSLPFLQEIITHAARFRYRMCKKACQTRVRSFYAGFLNITFEKTVGELVWKFENEIVIPLSAINRSVLRVYCYWSRRHKKLRPAVSMAAAGAIEPRKEIVFVFFVGPFT